MLSALSPGAGQGLRALGGRLFDSAVARALLRRHRARLLDEAVARGLPQRFAAPLRWLVDGELGREDARRIAPIEARRAELALRRGESAPSPGGRPVPLPRLALAASVNQRFGTLLYLYARAVGARVALELGSCVGVGTAYLAAAGCERVVSVEASPERAALARETAALGGGGEVIVGRFDDVLPDVLANLDGEIEIAWIDGHHEKEATLRYFEQIRPQLAPGAVVAFDDISWTPEMRAAWAILAHSEGFTDTLDLDAIGIGIWAGGGVSPRIHDLRGIWGPPRRLAARLERLRSR